MPKRLLVIGGGIIGLEMATVYAALGAKLSVVELTGQLMPGADPDLVRPLEKRLKARYEQILLNTKVTGCTAQPEGLAVEFEDANGKRTDVFDRVLVAVGRSANGKRIGLESRGHRRERPGHHSRRQADAHQSAARVRHRRPRAGADARAQGHA